MLTHLWLVYTAFYAVYPFAVAPGPYGLGPHAAGLAVFLALYVLGHRAQGRRRLGVVVGLGALGALTSWLNPGALVFFIYASSFVGGAATGLAAGVWIAAATGAGLATAVWAGWSYWPILAGVAVFTPLIGFVNVQDAAGRRRDAALRLAHDEIARLAVLAERHRIAADLHDVLGHTLSVIVLKSELASKLAAGSPDAAAAEMADVERIAREALASTRKVVTGFHAASLADEWLRARSVLSTGGVKVTLTPADGAPDVRDLAPEAEHALAMVLREAVTNVLRHAAATSCDVSVSRQGGEWRLIVHDDGRGGPIREGNGVRGMRARLAEVGGRLDLTQGPGVRLSATVPARGESHA